MELDVGDQISLVKKSKVPEEDHHLVKKLQYELCRLPGEDKTFCPGEILVQTTTEPIIIDDDSDTEASVYAKVVEQSQQSEGPLKKEGAGSAISAGIENVVSPDDYEVGEPSRIPPPPKPPKTDPVSLVSFDCCFNI